MKMSVDGKFPFLQGAQRAALAIFVVRRWNFHHHASRAFPTMQVEVLLLLFLPLLGFLVNGLLGSTIKSDRLSGLIGSGVMVMAFGCAAMIAAELWSAPEHALHESVVVADWISAGKFAVSLGYRVDALSVLMSLIITGVGSLIHIYSIGYMHGDKAVWRFFAYLNLFVFAMLQLVMADNFLLTFLGWEGVGLCSYLLIGFWYDKPFEGTKIRWTGDAAMKAFVVNRLGDFGFLIAMFIIFLSFGSLNYEEVFHHASMRSVGDPAIVLATLFLFLACTGKSAQLPLYVWLPDAMAGPTPVSALIHAATMVTSGLFLITRASVMFALAPSTLAIVAVVGAVTALFAATIGLVQQDIKKVLAYSTVSQLGYMFLAMGCGAFGAGMFHVTTHAFFKALLFLGSGAVIHAMHGEQNIIKMGGLQKYLPVTFRTFFIGTLAIAGIPPLAGFFSKDEILWQAWEQSPVLWAMGFVAALFTAFYMWRLLTLTFFGPTRFNESHVHPHEAPRTMTVPLVILAALSAIAGFAGMPALFHLPNIFDEWLEPVTAKATEKLFAVHGNDAGLEIGLMLFSVVIAAVGILMARRLYAGRGERAAAIAARFHGAYSLLFNKYYVDEIYDTLFVRPLYWISERLLWKWADVGLIDGAVNGTAALVIRAGDIMRRTQVGLIQVYAAVVVIGVVIIIAWLSLL
jgi:NADH-quinone oxidoreductase subunit L